jgi:hypothetical protein
MRPLREEIKKKGFDPKAFDPSAPSGSAGGLVLRPLRLEDFFEERQDGRAGSAPAGPNSGTVDYALD